MKIQNVKQIFYAKLEEAARDYGVIPEMEGALPALCQEKLRLRCSFRNFSMNPVSDSEFLLSGEVTAEILNVPGKMESADGLCARVIQIFSPEQGELQNGDYRILISSVVLLELKEEGKYQRSGVSFQITVWGDYDS